MYVGEREKRITPDKSDKARNYIVRIEEERRSGKFSRGGRREVRGHARAFKRNPRPLASARVYIL